MKLSKIDIFLKIRETRTHDVINLLCYNIGFIYGHTSGADPGFQVRGAHLNKLCRAEGGAKIFGVFRVKNHDFTPKNHNFSNFRGGAPGARPLDPPLHL